MNIHQVAFFCFLSAALRAGNTGLIRAKHIIYTGAEGGSGSVSCHLSLAGNTKFFCRDECQDKDILVKTEDVRAQNGRFSIEYKNGSSGGGILKVTISRLTKSDAGRYRCGLSKSLFQYSYQEFEVRVSDGGLLDGYYGFLSTNTEGEEVTHSCSRSVYRGWKFFCRNDCKKQEDVLIETDGNKTQSGRYSMEYREGATYGLQVTIAQVTESDTGRYRCGYGRALSPELYSLFPIIVVDANSNPKWTPQSFSTPAPPVSTPTTTQSLSSGSFTPLSVYPKTTDQFTVYLFPLVVCVLLVVALFALVLLLLYKMKTMTVYNSNMECVTYENSPPAFTCEDTHYQSLDPASRDQNQIYLTQHN